MRLSRLYTPTPTKMHETVPKSSLQCIPYDKKANMITVAMYITKEMSPIHTAGKPGFIHMPRTLYTSY